MGKMTKSDKKGLWIGVGCVIAFLAALAVLVCFVPISTTTAYRINDPSNEQLAILEKDYANTVKFVGIERSSLFPSTSIIAIYANTTALNASDIDKYFIGAKINEYQFMENIYIGFKYEQARQEWQENPPEEMVRLK